MKTTKSKNFAFLKKGDESSFCHHLLRIYFYFVTVIDAKWYYWKGKHFSSMYYYVYFTTYNAMYVLLMHIFSLKLSVSSAGFLLGLWWLSC